MQNYTLCIYPEAMTIELTQEQEEFVQQQLASGRFASEAEVINEIFSLWQERERNVAEVRSLLREAQTRNAGVDLEKAESVIEDAIRDYRRNRQH
ncbi:MAG: type II toxin-antitoxin system ParD family antitoxin [Trueperaceae bacterium]|nr:MAG: type II toxin-antitoxin system ParD family antitoxin [Trueperaceae bacterium]